MLAITRPVSSAIGRCELTHLTREPIDVERAERQHREYEMRLSDLGCEILRLPAEPLLPDSVFVEDTAVVFEEIAIITRPGVESRRGEVTAVAEALGAHRALAYIEAPGTLDGGDVLRLGRSVYVGEGHRSNSAGVAQLRRHLRAHGYSVHSVSFSGCLHLKSAVTMLPDRSLLINPRWIDRSLLGDLDTIEVDESEPAAANGLAINGALIYPLGFPLTAQRLKRRGIRIVGVDISELRKAEGAVTCCSLVFSRQDRS